MKINLDRKVIRNFGLILAFILTAFGFYKLYRGQTTFSYVLLSLSFIAAVSALFFQPLMRPIYIGAMKLSFYIGWVNTRILLFVIYYLLLSPMSLILKMFGKKFLDEKIEPHQESYWIKRERIPFDKITCERQF